MKYVIATLITSLFLFSTNGYAEVTDSALREYISQPKQKHEPTLDELIKLEPKNEKPIHITIEQKSLLPDWAWVAVGVVASSMVWGTFWYTRGK